MKKEQIALISAIVMLIIACAVVTLQSRELNRKNAELKSAYEQISSLQMNYKLALESIERANDVVAKFLKSSTESAEKNVKTIKQIENDTSACDWLNADIPDVVRFEFCTTGDRESHTSEGASSALH